MGRAAAAPTPKYDTPPLLSVSSLEMDPHGLVGVGTCVSLAVDQKIDVRSCLGWSPALETCLNSSLILLLRFCPGWWGSMKNDLV